MRNSLGVVGRLNPTQLYNHELAYITEEIQRKARLISDTKKALKAFTKNLSRFYELACPDLFKFITEELDKEDLAAFMLDLFENGNMPIHQPPFFGNATIELMITLYDEFEIEKTKFEGIQDKLIFAKLYHIKLIFSFTVQQCIVVTFLIAGNSKH